MTTPAQALENSGVGAWLRDSLWAYPAVETTHIVALAVVYGSIVMVDLRLLGVSRALAVTRLLRHTLPWTAGAFGLALTTGLLLFTAHAADLLGSRVFMLKMGLLLTAGLNAGLLHAGVLRSVAAWDVGAAPPARARLAAVLSLVLWTCVIACGRLLAYT